MFFFSIQERVQLIQWSIRVRREKLLDALGTGYYNVVEDPKFWLYAMLASFAAAAVGGLYFKSEPVVAMGIGLFIVSGIWAMMADHDRQEMQREHEEQLLRSQRR